MGKPDFSDHTEEKQMTDTPKLRRGFACMSLEKRKEIARKGGSSVPASMRSFSQNKELAQRAGAAGGRASSGPRAK